MKELERDDFEQMKKEEDDEFDSMEHHLREKENERARER
jgi:hypothetical protein